jgi:SsrA-binding protein
VSLIENKRVYFDYEILDKFTAGLELLGQEVKSLRSKRGSLEGSRVLIRGKEAYVVNMDVPAYQPNNKPGTYDERRTRRLLLTEKEIKELENSSSKKGLTIVPISVYNKGRFIKMDIGIAKGKKNFDKRESIKKRESDIDIRRSLKRE